MNSGDINNQAYPFRLTRFTHEHGDEDVTFIRSNSYHQIHRNLGEIDLQGREHITFQVGQQELKVALQDRLIVGRRTTGNFPQPDIDVSRLTDNVSSVSRHHICISRQGTLLYVSDLSSTNGTWLNGNRVLANTQRILRDGDILCLGDVRVVIRYTC